MTSFYNQVYAKRNLEDLSQAAHRLNTLMQMSAVRQGHARFVDYTQGVKRVPMPREISFEMDKKIIQKTNEIMQKLLAISPDLRRPSMQEIIHFELLALEEFKERLREKRIKKLIMRGVKSSVRSSQIRKLPALEQITSKDLMEPEKHEMDSHEVEELIMVSRSIQTQSRPEESDLTIEKSQEIGHAKERSPEVSEIQHIKEVDKKVVEIESKQLEPKEPQLEKSVSEKLEFEEFTESVTASTEESSYEASPTFSNPDLELQSVCFSEQTIVPYDEKVKCAGITVREAMQTVKQNCSDREIVLLVSPLPGKQLRDSPLLQITLFSKYEKRILGSFQIPDKNLSAVEDEGVFKVYPAIFLSRSISSVQCNIDVVVKQLADLTRIHSNYDDVDRLFALAESYEYRIYARPDYGSEDAVYVCDFYTSSNYYIGTTRLYGLDVLGQLRLRPKILKHFELIVELNDRILPKKVKEVVDALLTRLSLTKIYEQVGLILFKIFRKLA